MSNILGFTLQQMIQTGLYEEVAQPKYVYHYTNKANVEKIIRDGYIDTMTDYVCWFFPEPENILEYLYLSNAYKGRKYYDFDGIVHQAPPFIPSEHALFKLYPLHEEPGLWYKENTVKKYKPVDFTEEELKEWIERNTAFDNCRICHYGNMAFTKEFEVYDMAQVLNELESYFFDTKKG